MDYYRLSENQVLKFLKSSNIGLSNHEANLRFRQFGPNILEDYRQKSIFKIIFEQISDFLIVLLIVSAVISFLLEGANLNFWVLVVIILLNATMGFILEYKAEKALKALRNYSPSKTLVRREGVEKEISNSLIVPGDIVLFKQGDKVPADMRILYSANIKIDESSFTGESVPSEKKSAILSEKTPVADQENMAFLGTNIVSGHGEGVVTAIAAQTEFGKIAHLVQKRDEKTPLQKRLIYLGKILILICAVLSLLIFLLGLWRDFPLFPLFSYVIALLVSAVPESLPTITTLALALGIINLVRKKAIVRRLPVLESLASVSLICTDKTGTITKDEMTVKKIWLPDLEIEITGRGYLPEGKFLLKNQAISPAKNSQILKLLQIADVCNNAVLNFDEKRNKWQISGDPTEGALKVLTIKGQVKTAAEKIQEFPFEFELKRMSQIAEIEKEKFLFSKGAPDKILEISDYLLTPEGKLKLTQETKKMILKKASQLADEGFRVLALAFKPLEKIPENRNKIEKGLIFSGLAGMIDPPTEGVEKALRLTRKAGIKTVIITGDHSLTAHHIAEQIGLEVSKDEILEGEDLEKLDQAELVKIADSIKIYARTSPFQKIKIVDALKSKGYQVAVTGDGVNDSPALKKADVGIAMGIRGTDVARESADMVLTDDRFPTIVSAIEYGRTIYENIKKFFTFLLSGNFDELVLVFFAFIFNLPQPFTALQILWINLITDSFPALALAFEKPSQNIMAEKPKDPSKGILKPVLKKALFLGILGFILQLIIFLISLDDINRARTMVFTSCVFFELFIVFSIRSERPFWRTNIFENYKLVGAVLVSILLQLFVLYGPLGKAFGVTSLNLIDWLIILAGCLICFVIAEIVKIFRFNPKP